MQAVILAAGLGTRMRPLTLEKPKPMLEVAGKPILARIIETLPPEITEIILVIGYKGDMIRSYFGQQWQGKRIIYVEQEKMEGTYAALLLAKPHLDLSTPFLHVFADDLYDRESFAKLITYSRAVLVAPVEHPERFGIVVPNEKGEVASIEEKPEHPKSNLGVTGAYMFDRHIFDYEPERHSNGEYYLPPVITKMIEDHPMAVVEASFWLPIGYPEDLAKAEEVLKNLESRI